MVTARFAIVFVIFYGICCIECAIINHHVNNIISKDEHGQNVTVSEIAVDDHSKIVAIQPRPAQNDGTEKKLLEQLKMPMKITQPHNKKILTSIIHPLPRAMHDIMPREHSHPTHLDHKKEHEDFLKHKGPQLQKKLHHHYTVEELRQKRKEFKEKWQAKHNKPHHVSPHGLEGKHERHFEVPTKFIESRHIVGKQDSEPSSPVETVTKSQNIVNDNAEKVKKDIADMYEQVTSRTRRILEHKEEPLSMEYAYESRPPLKIVKSPAAFEMNSAKKSVPSERHPLSTFEAKHSTESPFHPANQVVFPVFPYPLLVPPVDFFSSAPSPSTPHAISSSSFNAQSTERTSRFSFNPVVIEDRPIEMHKNYRSVAERTTTDVPEPIKDDVVTVKIKKSISVYPGMENDQVTISIDTPPYYRNLTYEEKILIQKPIFNGKSAELVGDSVDVHHVIEIEKTTVPMEISAPYKNSSNSEMILTQKPISNGKSEVVGDSINVHPGIEKQQVTVPIVPIFNGKSAEEKEAAQSFAETNISDEHPIDEGWKEHLREAVKERIRKFRRDSAEERLL